MWYDCLSPKAISGKNPPEYGTFMEFTPKILSTSLAFAFSSIEVPVIIAS